MKDNIKQLVGGIALIALAFALAWAYLELTPNQMSAECDWAQEEINNFERNGGAK